jgi:hypothetical protein
MTRGKYKVVGVRVNPVTSRPERLVLWRDEMYGDHYTACSAKFYMQACGYQVAIFTKRAVVEAKS